MVRREGAKGAHFTWFDIRDNYAGLNRGDGAVPGILMCMETTQTVAYMVGDLQCPPESLCSCLP